tara:strand:+ start:3134 stop:3667 length:534 start_codon:yes stop_codon:yes gene_type:complete
MSNIEVELRSFLNEEKFRELLVFFEREGVLKFDDEQLTYYFDCEQDLRIQKNNFYSKVWLKKGKLHDLHREEVELKLPVEKFEELEKLFKSLGYGVEIQWLRKRKTFEWKGVEVMLDHTKGYGYILELEKMASIGEEGEALVLLQDLMQELNVEVTPREKFEEKYKWYKENWKSVIS